MKKMFFFIGLSLCLVGSVVAQKPIAKSAIYHKTKKLNESEVPVTVMKSFESNFQTKLDKSSGTWFVQYLEEPERVSNERKFEPVAYSFSSKQKGNDKIEITFSPTGELESVHGMNDAERNSKE